MYMVKKKKVTIGRIKGHEWQHLKTSPTRALKRQGKEAVTPARPAVTEGAAWQALWPLEEVTASASPWWLIREGADALPRPGLPLAAPTWRLVESHWYSPSSQTLRSRAGRAGSSVGSEGPGTISSLLLVLARAAIIKYHRLDGLINRSLFLTILDIGSPR